jgi:hypothetical protein
MDRRDGPLISCALHLPSMPVMRVIQTRHGQHLVAVLILAIVGFCIAAIIRLTRNTQEPFTIDDLYGFLD